MQRVQDALSMKLNEEYERLSNQLKEIKEDKDFAKRVKALQKQIREVERNCRKNVLSNLKKGVNIVGALEFRLLNSCTKLRKRWSTWARTRGSNFQDLVMEKFQNYARTYGGIYPYKNAISKFGFQPYDVIIFCRDQTPLLLECKASGITQKKGVVSVQACKRRYVNYTDSNRIERIEKIKRETDTKLLFVFNDESGRNFWFLNSDLIYPNSTHLCNRNLVLKEDQYVKVPHESGEWPKEFENVLKRL